LQFLIHFLFVQMRSPKTPASRFIRTSSYGPGSIGKTGIGGSLFSADAGQDDRGKGLAIASALRCADRVARGNRAAEYASGTRNLEESALATAGRKKAKLVEAVTAMADKFEHQGNERKNEMLDRADFYEKYKSKGSRTPRAVKKPPTQTKEFVLQSSLRGTRK